MLAEHQGTPQAAMPSPVATAESFVQHVGEPVAQPSQQLVGTEWNGGTIMQGENGQLFWVSNDQEQQQGGLAPQQYTYPESAQPGFGIPSLGFGLPSDPTAKKKEGRSCNCLC